MPRTFFRKAKMDNGRDISVEHTYHHTDTGEIYVIKAWVLLPNGEEGKEVELTTAEHDRIAEEICADDPSDYDDYIDPY